LDKKQKDYEGDARIFSQRMFKGAAERVDEPKSKVTKKF
jgi:hypothetical protein